MSPYHLVKEYFVKGTGRQPEMQLAGGVVGKKDAWTSSPLRCVGRNGGTGLVPARRLMSRFGEVPRHRGTSPARTSTDLKSLRDH